MRQSSTSLSCVTAAHTESRDVRGDVGSILVDDSDNTQRDTQAFRAKSVVECSLVFDLEQGITPASYRSQRARHRGHPLTVEFQTISSRTRLVIGLQVGLVDPKKLGFALEKSIRHVGENGFTRLVGSLRQLRRGTLYGSALSRQSAGCHLFSVMAGLTPPEKDQVVAVHHHVFALGE